MNLEEENNLQIKCSDMVGIVSVKENQRTVPAGMKILIKSFSNYTVKKQTKKNKYFGFNLGDLGI
jgi:hypothetical protein